MTYPHHLLLIKTLKAAHLPKTHDFLTMESLRGCQSKTLHSYLWNSLQHTHTHTHSNFCTHFYRCRPSPMLPSIAVATSARPYVVTSVYLAPASSSVFPTHPGDSPGTPPGPLNLQRIPPGGGRSLGCAGKLEHNDPVHGMRTSVWLYCSFLPTTSQRPPHGIGQLIWSGPNAAQFNSITLHLERKYGYYSDRTWVRKTGFWPTVCPHIARLQAGCRAGGVRRQGGVRSAMD